STRRGRLEVCGAPPPVREDRGGRAAGVRVVLPRALPGSHARSGEALTASKREAPPKMTPPIPVEGVRPLVDHQVAWAAGARPVTGAAERSQSAEGLRMLDPDARQNSAHPARSSPRSLFTCMRVKTPHFSHGDEARSCMQDTPLTRRVCSNRTVIVASCHIDPLRAMLRPVLAEHSTCSGRFWWDNRESSTG